jgi:hypothetical protein
MVLVIVAMVGMLRAQDPPQGYEVHDRSRPQPPVVTPGTCSTQDQPGKPPSDAIVLFDGKDLSSFKSEKGDVPWKVADGYFEIVPRSGPIQTKQEFGDIQLHIEWREPDDVKGKDQGRGNSGIFLMGLYELQVLDNYQSDTYPDGMAGSIYGQYPPLANAMRPPGQWEMYDVVFRAPRLDSDGKVSKPARITVFFNGVIVQDDTELIGPTMHKQLATYPAKHPEKGPIMLQDHGSAVRYRNIWVRELPKEKPQPPNRPAGAGH